MKKIILLILLFLLFGCIAKNINHNANRSIVIDKDTCFVENEFLDSKISGEFDKLSFHELNRSNFKREIKIVENPYSMIRDTLFTFSTDREYYNFLYVTHLEKIIPVYFSINYENRYEDKVGFYDQFQELIDTFDVNECNVTIVSSESGMIRLIISKENDKMRRLEFETDIEIGNTADDHLEEQSTTRSEEENVWDTAVETYIKSASSEELGDLNSNESWSNDCSSNYYVSFGVVGAQFSFSTNYTMNTKLKKLDDTTYAVYFRFPIIRPIPENMQDCRNYAENIPVAKIERIGDGLLEFTWLGFYDVEKKARVHTQNPFNMSHQPVILGKCDE